MRCTYAVPLLIVAAFAVSDSSDSQDRAVPVDSAGHAAAQDPDVHAMHEAWCALAGHGQQSPCMKHRVMQELGMMQEQRQARLAAIDEQIGHELVEAQNLEMHDWWCTRKEAAEAAEGSSLRDFCDGWTEHKLKDVAIAMHEAWCATLLGNEKGHGPCLKHRVIQETHAAESSELLTGQLSEMMALIDKEVPRDVGEAQNREMHDWWCGRPEVTEAAEGSSLRVYCDGWAAHKLKEEL